MQKPAAKDWAEFSRTETQTRRAKKLRHEATPAERILWTKLCRAQLGGFKFRRQHPVGPYVLDFYCPAIKLCVELDGGQHGFDREIVRDVRRTAFLDRRRIDVLRFWNDEVKENPIGVADTILDRANDLKRFHATGGIPSPWKGEG